MHNDVVYILAVTVEPWEDGGGNDYIEGAYKGIAGALRAVVDLVHADYPGKRFNVTDTTLTRYGHRSTVTIWDDDVPDYPLAYIVIGPTPLES